MPRERPLPPTVIAPTPTTNDVRHDEEKGVILGQDVRWNPEVLANAHICIIGGSGSGKTQTLKAIAYGMGETYPQTQRLIIDFHGDQELPGECCYDFHQASPHGINPLIVDLDPAGGGPALQAIQVVSSIKKSLRLGPNQEGLLLELVTGCYSARGIVQFDKASWRYEPPTFADLESRLEELAGEEDKDCKKLLLKMRATFTYGIFNRVQPKFTEPLIRINLSKLPPELQSVASESLLTQIMNNHRLSGEIEGKIPKTYVFVDEVKELKGSAILDRIFADARKYGLGLGIGSQTERHISLDLIGNSSTKIVLPVDQTEVKKVSNKFRFGESVLAGLVPLTALVRMGTKPYLVPILPFYKRVQNNA